MTAQAQHTSVREHVVVEAPIEHAFAVFTEGIGSWFPPEYNLLQVEIAERVFEAREGGHVYDRGVHGSECHWARVLAYEPPHRVVISWDIDPQWQIETNPRRRARSRSGSSRKRQTARASSSSTATSSDTARGGSGRETQWAPRADGRVACGDSWSK
jgi:uncharacterized protein YndB with AHSA1/START domain